MTVMVERIEFFRAATEGRVHVSARFEGIEGLPPLYQRRVALCGRRGRAGVLDSVGSFNDRELCARCWQATPADDRPLLFEHPQDA